MKGGWIVEKLKALIDKKFESRAEFAKAIGVDPSVLSRMLASGNWKADRIEQAVKVLRIPAKDIPVYFFANEVAKNGTNKERECV
jgi:predicted transcriptional regulator